MALYKYIKEKPHIRKKRLWSVPRFKMAVRISLPKITMPILLPKRNITPAYAIDNFESPRRKNKAIRTISLSIGLLGILMIAWVAYPIVSFEIASRTKFAKVIEPIPATQNVLGWEQVTSANGEALIAKQVATQDKKPAVAGASTDYTRANNWLPDKPQLINNSSGKKYFLSIPQVGIDNAIVKIAGDDLDKSLIHYGGTGLPGDYGSAVIFGHSTLPQFYNPKNYKAIFSKIPTLEEGDEIFVKYDGITYKYVIYSMRVTTPDDISILEQRYDTSYLTLVTCVPPGTYWKRLEVKARLEPA